MMKDQKVVSLFLTHTTEVKKQTTSPNTSQPPVQTGVNHRSKQGKHKRQSMRPLPTSMDTKGVNHRSTQGSTSRNPLPQMGQQQTQRQDRCTQQDLPHYFWQDLNARQQQEDPQGTDSQDPSPIHIPPSTSRMTGQHPWR